MVNEVFSGYAAQAAGLVTGDVLSTKGESVRGPVGTKVTIDVMRPAATTSGAPTKFRLTMTRERICLRRPSVYGLGDDVVEAPF